MAKKREKPSRKIRISAHTAELLDVYAEAFEAEMGVTLTRDQAVDRMVQVFIGNPMAARTAKKPEATHG